MLDLQIIPEQHVGCEHWQFVLGMHLRQIIAIIKSQAKSIRTVEIQYPEQDTLSMDLTLDMPGDGICLVFCSVHQRLKKIEITDLSLVKLKYCGQYFNNGSQVVPTMQQIEQSFGPTQPVAYDPEEKSLVMTFRGISFFFPVKAGVEVTDFSDVLNNLSAEPVVRKICIYAGSSLQDAVLPPLPLSCYHGNVFAESVKVWRVNGYTKGLDLSLLCEGPGHAEGEMEILHRQAVVKFGDNCQSRVALLTILCRTTASESFLQLLTFPHVFVSVLATQKVQSLLGSPEDFHYKCDDRMKIHSASPNKMANSCSDYFYNYYNLGLDILFDFQSNTVKKFLLHTNFPNHFDFDMYNRCPFSLELDASPAAGGLEVDMRLGHDFSSASPAAATAATPYSDRRTFTVEACTKWDDLVAAFANVDDVNRPTTEPVVLTRASSTNGVNPFRPSHCYHCQRVIFETIPSSSHIAAVTLYMPMKPACDRPILERQADGE